MRLFGLTITREKLQSVPMHGGGWRRVLESFAGAWQRNIEITLDGSLSDPTVYACVSLISSDVAKCRLRLVQQEPSLIWTETESPAFSPVLRKPNRYQTRIEFISQWVISKLLHGNTYVLKEREGRGLVVGMHILDPRRVQPLIAENGDVYYQLSRDDLAELSSDITVPASEIIHDRMNALFHPLVGIPPLYAAGLAATQSVGIRSNSAKFFSNGARPGGILTAPGEISDETAIRLKDYFDKNFSGENAGKVAVVGDGLKYEAMMMPAADSQLVEQMKASAEAICGAFHVPAYMVGVGAPPLNNNVESLWQLYYSQCLQIHIEAIEAHLDEGLALPKPYGTEFDLDDLLRMDQSSLVKSMVEATNAGWVAPDEARRKIGLPPTQGGDTPFMQHQQWPLRVLANRTVPPEEQAVQAAQAAAQAAPEPPEEPDDTDRAIAAVSLKFMEALHAA